MTCNKPTYGAVVAKALQGQSPLFLKAKPSVPAPPAKRKHLGPYGEGHIGDMPVLTVDGSGNATKAVVAPHLTVADVKGHSIMIHAGGDDYSDQPTTLGGGGARIACGVAK